MFYVLLALFTLASCDLDQLPTDTAATEAAFASEVGIEQATLGQYTTFLKNITVRGQNNWQFNIPRAIDLVNLEGDDMLITNSYLDLTSINQYDPISLKVDGNFNLGIWAAYYKNIAVANKIIADADISDPTVRALVGENHYLRALWYMHLTRAYGLPYTHGRDNLSVPLRLDPESSEPQARATVGEVFDQIVSDLNMAAEMLPSVSIRTRPSKEAAWGMLSRIYVWMADPDNPGEFADLAIENANKVINSGSFALTPTESYFGSTEKRPINLPVGTPISHYFSKAQNENETLFCMGIVTADEGIIARGRMWLQTIEGLGFGQYCASDHYLNVLNSDTSDLRGNFIEPRYELDANGNNVLNADGEPVLYQHNGFDQYNINKMSYFNGNPHLADIQVQRSAEVYLNRAEAYAKKGDIAAALADVNLVRERANATPINSLADFNTIYPMNPGSPDKPGNGDILDVVLTERFLELAWEFNRSVDAFRNKRNLYRNYNGPHTLKEIIQWNNPRQQWPIPQAELFTNPLLVQNNY